ncbi:MAG: GNAT family N-acetyltransferase [Bacteroidota bacterium]
MTTDYLSSLSYLGLFSRIKRISDSTIADGRKLYKYIDIGIEPNWFLIFRILMEKGETSVSEITALLKFAHPSVISIVKKMEEAGYLEIRASQTDKRKQVIAATKKAKDELPEMQKVWKACELAVSSIFVDDTFLKGFERLEKAFEAESFFDRVLNNLSRDQIKVADYTSRDKKVFASLNRAWINKYFAIEDADRMVFKNPEKYILEKGGHILMAHYRDQAVGTVALLPHNSSEVELCRMAVNPEFQGKGIGSRLMEAAIAKVKEEAYASIILYTNTQLTAAVKLYLKYRFEEEPIEANFSYQRANLKMRHKLSQ